MAIRDTTIVEQVRTHDWVVSPPAAVCVEQLVREGLHAETIPIPDPHPEADGRVVQDVLVSLSCGAAAFSPPHIRAGA